MDENLTFKDMQAVAKDTMISAKELSPYSVMDSGFGGERKVELDQEEVFDTYKSISKRLDKDVRKGKVNKRLKDRSKENEKLDKEIAKDDKKLESILTRHGYDAKAIMGKSSSLYEEGIVTKGLNKLGKAYNSTVDAVSRGGEWVANKLGLSSTMKDPKTGEMSGRGGFGGFLDSLLGRNTSTTQQAAPQAVIAAAGNDATASVSGATADGGPSAPADKQSMIKAIWATMLKNGITSRNEQASFLAQIGHETGNLKYLEEIASGNAYNGRKDLGNAQPGDGPRFKGRGMIQLTGRANYTKFSQAMNRPDIMTNPKLVATDPTLAAESAFYYWKTRKGLREAAQRGDIVKVSKLVNGGTNGLQDRKNKFAAYLKGEGPLWLSSEAQKSGSTNSSSTAATAAATTTKAAGGSSTAGTKSTTTTPSKSTGTSSTTTSTSSSSTKSSKADPGVKENKVLENTNSKADNAVAPIAGDSMPAKAAKYARSKALKKSSGYCSRYVRTAIQAGGYKLVHPSLAYQNHTQGRLTQCGFVQIHAGTRWQVGDVIVNNSKNGGKHAGHIQIWDGQNWISDFIQNKVVHYQGNSDIAYYRDARYLNGATKVTGWQNISLLSGAGSGGLPATDVGGEGYTNGATGGTVQYKKWEMKKITSSDELHGRVKTDDKKTTEKGTTEKTAPTKTDASHGKDDKGKAQSDQLKKDTAVTVSKTTKGSATGTGPASTKNKGTSSSSKPTNGRGPADKSGKKPPTSSSPSATPQSSGTGDVIGPAGMRTSRPHPQDIQKVGDPYPDRSAEISAAEEKIRQQKQHEQELQQQQAKNQAMLKLLEADRSILEKQLMIQNDMLHELKGIHQHLKQWKVGEPSPMGNPPPPQVAQPKPESVRPKAPDRILEPVSMMKF